MQSRAAFLRIFSWVMDIFRTPCLTHWFALVEILQSLHLVNSQQSALQPSPTAKSSELPFRECLGGLRIFGGYLAPLARAGRDSQKSALQPLPVVKQKKIVVSCLGRHSQSIETVCLMGWLRLVGSLKWSVSFAEYSLFYRALLQKRPVILRSLLIVATPLIFSRGALANIRMFLVDICNAAVVDLPRALRQSALRGGYD